MAWWLGWLPQNLSPHHVKTSAALQQLPGVTSRYQALLQRFVNAQGLVNYQGLGKQQAEVDNLLGILAQVSPSSHPSLFPTRQDKVAYWINAYNLSVLRAMLHFPNFDSLIPYINKVRFFAIIRFTYGGKSYNLYNLENKWIRPQYQEPRVHFALNCASIGCPQLPHYAFVSSKLEQQLDYETRKFLGQKQNVRVDHTNKVIYLSSILQWYRSDFTEALDAQKIPAQASDRILDYVNRYRTKGKKLPAQGYRVAYIPYDWRLNRQK